MNPSSHRRRQRAVMATDSEWARLKEQARAAGMDVSRFILERLTAPDPNPAGTLERVERAVAVLLEVEKARMAGNGEADAWDAFVRQAESRLEQERNFE